jgi:hypothetical protein
MANWQVQLVGRQRAWVVAEITSVGASGHLSPLLLLNLQFKTPTERIAAELHHVQVRVFGANEFIGSGSIVGAEASWYASPFQLAVPVTHQMLRYMTSTLPPNADPSLKLTWSGLLRVKWHPGEDDPRMQSDPEADEWVLMPFTQTDLNFGIPRSDWFGQVLQAVGDDQYIYQEVAIPKGPGASDWRSTLVLVEEAEKAYALGDDPGVFTKLRGALDALPGAKKNIVDALPEPRRAAIDALLLAVGNYLHSGRHVAVDGEAAGTFPVNRIDADAAISLMRVLLSYISRALAAARDTGN